MITYGRSSGIPNGHDQMRLPTDLLAGQEDGESAIATPVHSYRERPPAPGLRGLVACTWTHVWTDGASVGEVEVVPDACIDIVWRDDGLLQVAGPDTGPWRAPLAGSRYVGLRVLPGAAPSLLVG